MHNEVRVDPLNQIAEVNEANNSLSRTPRSDGGGGMGAFNELRSPRRRPSPDRTEHRGPERGRHLRDQGRERRHRSGVGVVVRDFLPAGARTSRRPARTVPVPAAGWSDYIECVGGQIPANTPTATADDHALGVRAGHARHLHQPGDRRSANTIPEGNEFNNQATCRLIVTNGGIGSLQRPARSQEPDQHHRHAEGRDHLHAEVCEHRARTRR